MSGVFAFFIRVPIPDDRTLGIKGLSQPRRVDEVARNQGLGSLVDLLALDAAALAELLECMKARGISKEDRNIIKVAHASRPPAADAEFGPVAARVAAAQDVGRQLARVKDLDDQELKTLLSSLEAGGLSLSDRAAIRARHISAQRCPPPPRHRAGPPRRVTPTDPPFRLGQAARDCRRRWCRREPSPPPPIGPQLTLTTLPLSRLPSVAFSQRADPQHPLRPCVVTSQPQRPAMAFHRRHQSLGIHSWSLSTARSPRHHRLTAMRLFSPNTAPHRVVRAVPKRTPVHSLPMRKGRPRPQKPLPPKP